MNPIYIEPIFISSSSLEGIEQYNCEQNSSYQDPGRKMFRQVGFDSLLHQQATIVLGEPGCGKSEFIRQLQYTLDEKKD